MEKTPLLYFPTLQAQLAPENLPEETCLMPTGLEQPHLYEHSQVSPLCLQLFKQLPWHGKKAKAILAELLEIGSTLYPDQLHLTLAHSETWPPQRVAGSFQQDEKNTLNAFSQTGQLRHSNTSSEDSKPPSNDISRLRIAAQKVLLLASHLESTYLETMALEEIIDAQNINLWTELHGKIPAEKQEDRSHEQGHRQQNETGPLASVWKNVTEALLFFCPTSVMLLTAHPDIKKALLSLPSHLILEDGEQKQRVLHRISHLSVSGIWSASGRQILNTSQNAPWSQWLDSPRIFVTF